jgi:hypothetical protein
MARGGVADCLRGGADGELSALGALLQSAAHGQIAGALDQKRRVGRDRRRDRPRQAPR